MSSFALKREIVWGGRQVRLGPIVFKSRFAPLTKDFRGSRRGFRVNMWGTSSPGGELTGDFGNEPDANIYQRSWLVSSSGGEFVTCRFQTFATQSAKCKSRAWFLHVTFCGANCLSTAQTNRGPAFASRCFSGAGKLISVGSCSLREPKPGPRLGRRPLSALQEH